MAERISKLILKTFDGSMKKATINPKFLNTKIEFKFKYYNANDELTNAITTFKGVVAVDFEINYFDNYIGSELCGLYEIFHRTYKIDMIEKVFQNRLKHFLIHDNYHYDENEENDMLNYRENFNEIVNKIDEYHLYEQQTEGGIFSILAKGYILTEK